MLRVPSINFIISNFYPNFPKHSSVYLVTMRELPKNIRTAEKLVLYKRPHFAPIARGSCPAVLWRIWAQTAPPHGVRSVLEHRHVPANLVPLPSRPETRSDPRRVQICTKAHEFHQNPIWPLIAGIMATTGQNNPLNRRGATAFNFINLRQCTILVLCPLNGQNRHTYILKRL